MTSTTALLRVVLFCPLAPLALAVKVLWIGRWAGMYVLGAAVLGLLGVGLLALVGPRLALAVAGVERWRLRLADDTPTQARRGGDLYTDPTTWRAVAYLL